MSFMYTLRCDNKNCEKDYIPSKGMLDASENLVDQNTMNDIKLAANKEGWIFPSNIIAYCPECATKLFTQEKISRILKRNRKKFSNIWWLSSNSISERRAAF